MTTVAQLVRMWGGLGQAAAAPIITSLPTGGVNEGETLAFALTADQTVTWSIVGGADAASFEISGSTLRWTANGTKAYADGGQNDYVVIVRATNPTTGRIDEDPITITVDEVTETAPILLADQTSYRGADTKAGHGVTLLRDLMWEGGDAPETWTLTRTSGTAGHFTEPTDGTFPTPTTTGDAAGLNGGPYVYNVVAHAAAGDSNVAELTINVRANTFTISKRSEITTVLSAGINGKTVEFAEGSTDLALSTMAAPMTFLRWRSASGCTIKHENAANKCPIGNLYIRLPLNLTFDGVFVTPQARTSAGASEKAVQILTSSPGVGESESSVHFEGCGITGAANTATTVWGVYFVTGAGGNLTATTNNWSSTWVSNDLYYNNNANASLIVTHSGITDLRYFTKNADRVDPGTSGTLNVTYAHRRIMTPRFDATQSSVHADGFQLNANESCSGIVYDRYTVILADGDSSACQGFFTSNGGFVGAVIKNYIYVGRSTHACTVIGSDATHPFRLGNFTFLLQCSGIYGTHGGSGDTLWDDRPGASDIPGVVLGSANSDIVIKDGYIQGQVSNLSSYTVPGTVTTRNNSGDVSGLLPNADWITSTALKATIDALANNVDNYTGVADARWTGTTAEVYDDVIAALTPASGTVGAVSSDGSRPLATF
jgi:hypothetical protein